MSKFDFTDEFADAMEACKSFRHAIDAGANVGAWTELLAGKFQWVSAFEPVDPAFKSLEARMSKHANVDCYNTALLDSERAEEFTINHVGFAQRKAGEQRNVVFNGLPLDRYNLGDVDFIKLDVDGSEHDVLTGALKTIERWKPVIFVEVKLMSANEASRLRDMIGYRMMKKFRIDELWVPN